MSHTAKNIRSCTWPHPFESPRKTMYKVSSVTPEWWNWQTRGTQNPVTRKGVRVRPPPPAPCEYRRACRNSCRPFFYSLHAGGRGMSGRRREASGRQRIERGCPSASRPISPACEREGRERLAARVTRSPTAPSRCRSEGRGQGRPPLLLDTHHAIAPAGGGGRTPRRRRPIGRKSGAWMRRGSRSSLAGRDALMSRRPGMATEASPADRST